MKKKSIAVTDDTIIEKGKTYTIDGGAEFADEPDELSRKPLPKKETVDYSPPKSYFQIVESFNGRTPLTLANMTIIDPEYIIQRLITHKMSILFHIRSIIDAYIKESPRIRKASITGVAGFPWTEFRKLRRSCLENTNLSFLSQPPDILKPDTIKPIFPIVPISDYGDLSTFQIIRDDCDDLARFLEGVEKLSPHFLSYLLSEVIYHIESRFHYLMGYHRKKFERGKTTKEFNEIAGKWTEDRVEKILDDCCGGIIGYDTLPRGKKKPIRDKIGKSIRDDDGRNVYKILARLRKKSNKYCPPERSS
ncbi:MAG: hypothetical protein A4E66_00844 [Syntrophus sp. PtaB.Bin001]|nr:MAG: hypothetical protein A4E66_00844 [Syntrophus sp. PtaB.Bin001]